MTACCSGQFPTFVVKLAHTCRQICPRKYSVLAWTFFVAKNRSTKAISFFFMTQKTSHVLFLLHYGMLLPPMQEQGQTYDLRGAIDTCSVFRGPC